MNKYHNRPVDFGGYHFDSHAEMARYLDLKLRQQAGEITGLVVHPKYTLIDPFSHGGVRERATMYEADFAYFENGRHIAEDVKGVETAVFKIKRKLFLVRYPDIDLKVVKV